MSIVYTSTARILHAQYVQYSMLMLMPLCVPVLVRPFVLDATQCTSPVLVSSAILPIVLFVRFVSLVLFCFVFVLFLFSLLFSSILARTVFSIRIE